MSYDAVMARLRLFVLCLAVSLLFCGNVCMGIDVAVAALESTPGLFSITQELLLRGHRVRVAIPEGEWDRCRLRVGPLSCVPVPYLSAANAPVRLREISAEDTSSALGRALTKGDFHPQVFLTDITARKIVDIGVASQLNKPTVLLAEDIGRLQLLLPEKAHDLLSKTWVGQLGGELDTALAEYHLIVPFPFGIGFPDSRRYPNVHTVGFLPERLLPSRGLSDAANAWIDMCTNGIIYVEIGVEDTEDWYVRTAVALNRLSLKRNICIVWKQLRGDLMHEMKPMSPLFISVGDEFDREALLGRNNTKFYVYSRCDTETLAMAARSETVPIVLRKIAPRYTTVCNTDLLNETSLGLVVDTGGKNLRLYEYFDAAWNDTSISHSMRRTFRYNHLLGGPTRAAQVVELVAHLGRENRDFFSTKPTNWVRRHDFDVVVCAGGIVALGILILVRKVIPSVATVIGFKW